MADCESLVSTSEGEKHVFVACQHVVRALRAQNNLNSDLTKLLSDLDIHLSKITLETKTEVMESTEIEERFEDAEKKILGWESNHSMVWETGPNEAAQYLQAIYDIQKVLGGFRGLPVGTNLKQREFYNRSKIVLEIAMSRLETELCHMLDLHKQYIQPKHMDLRSHGEDIAYDESFVSLEDEAVGETLLRNRSNKEHEEHIVDLVHPSVLPHIKSIANAMFASDYGQEFCEAFISIRKDALDEYLITSKIERFSIGDVLKMEWEDLNCEIKKWAWVLKVIVRVYLASEKRLCEQILGDFESCYPFCFIEISRDSILSLLNFGEAVAMVSHRPEILIRLLDMCEVLADVLSDVDHLLSEEAGSYLKIEFHGLAKKLGDSARATFMKFKNAIASDESSSPFPGGGIHPLTRYVMNYSRLLPTYDHTLNSLLKDQEATDSGGTFEKDGQDIAPSTFSATGSHLRSITSILEANLQKKARLYQDESLLHIFMMNNLHYMVQKVKGSELRLFFGDEWIRKHNAKFQQHATNYERATWSSVLSLLRDDGSQRVLQERCKLFSLAFEDVYRNQTRWCIPDPELRDDITISSSLKVIQSYRGFLGRNEARIGERHIRYTCEDLEKLLLDLFEGSSRSLRHSLRHSLRNSHRR